jgi:hypothetical protein
LEAKVKDPLVERGEEDKNTKFFNQVANSHPGNNSINSLVVNGAITFDSIVIKEHIVQLYKQLYSEQFSWQPKLGGLLFLSI